MAGFNQTSGGDVDIDLPRLGQALWKRRFAVVATALAAGIAAFLIAQSMTPLYRGEARIIIESREPAVTTGAAQPREMVLDAQAIASQVEVVRSAGLLRHVIEELDLAGLPEFDPDADPSLVDRLLGVVGIGGNAESEARIDQVLRAFRQKLEVYQVENSRVIGIEFSSRDPQLAARVANELAATYLQMQSSTKLSTNADATAWLEPEIEDLGERVRSAEQAVADFRAENGLFTVGQDDSLSNRQLADLSTELSDVRRERADAEAKASTVREALDEGRPTDAISSVLESNLIQRLRERQIAIEGEIADLSITLLDNHPRIRGLRSQLAGLDAQVREEVRKALASLENDAEVARRREQELTDQLNLLKANTAEANADEVELRALERQANAARQLLETYMARYREAVSLGEPGALPADARVISEASVPSKPYFPKTLPIVIVAMLGAALIHVIVIMLAELLSGRALKPVGAGVRAEDMGEAATATVPPAPDGETGRQRLLAAPVAAAAIRPEPEVKEEAEPRAADRQEPVEDVLIAPAAVTAGGDVQDDDLDEDFSVAAVAEALIARRASLVCGLSPEGDAATMGSVALSRRLSAEGQRVLYIDMTGTGAPGETMAGRGNAGMTDLLCGEIAIADAIHADRLSRVDVIPLGRSDADRAMRAASRISMIVEALGDAYDMVIVECGTASFDRIRHLIDRKSFEIVLSVVEPDPDMLEAELGALIAEGRSDALILLVEPNHAETASGAA